MSFTTGLSALRANQIALSVVGNNIANASTEGFRRQEVLFVENPHIKVGAFSIGTGVSIGDIRRAGTAALEDSLLKNTSDSSALTTQLRTARQIESLFIPGTGTLHERTEELFINMERLSALPTDATLRSSVVHSAVGVTDEINRVANVLDSMIRDAELEIERTVAEINSKARDIAKLTEQIVTIENTGRDAFGLRNQREVLVRDLAELIDVERRITGDGTETYVMGGGLFAMENGLDQMQLIRNELGQLEVWREGCDEPHKIGGGRLAGLLNQEGVGGLQGLRNNLGEFASALAEHLDAAHAIGVGIGGDFTSLSSARRLDDAAATLASQETISPIDAGSLFVSVTDQATGNKTLTELSIDPQAQSLNDVAAAIDAVNQIAANVDSQGRISIVAEPGFSFDFTGNLQTLPDAAGITGTTRPTMSGRFTGDMNDQYTFRFIGSGTVGVTDGLQVEVLNSDNLTVRVLDVGRDYEPSSELLVGDGVTLSLSSGTVNAADTFTVDLAGQPDEAGILAALGLNTLFVGDTPETISVNPTLIDNPSLFATTINADPSDTYNLHRMIGVRDSRIMRDGTATLEQFLADVVATSGSEVAELSRDIEGHDERRAFLESEFDALTGVDVNEELAKMLQYQRSYQAAARYIASLDDMLQELFAIAR